MKFLKRIACGASLSLLVLLSLGSVARAQTEPSQATPVKSYYYPSIATTIHVNQDSTIDVTEQQTYAFTENFHAGERDILLKGISGVTDISVTDVTTGVPLVESASRLDITDPASWGKFAVWKDDNANSQDVEWYFNLQDVTHTWAISYKVHGAIAFDQSYDRLYWNIFSGYTVPVQHADVSVILPEAVPASDINETYYRSSQTVATGTQPSYANGTFTFAANAFVPGEAYTIDVTWPKGVVSESAFWWDLFYLYLPMIVLSAAVFLCLLFLLLWWLFAIKLRERPGNVIPQYEPPDGLRPAVAEVVATENITSKGFAATIVDLAVRGFVRIDEDDQKSALPGAIVSTILPVCIAIFGTIFLIPLVSALSPGNFMSILFISLIFLALLVPAVIAIRHQYVKSDYRITALKDFASAAELKDYEKHYLSLILSVGDGKSVSTKDFKKLMGMQGRAFYQAITKLRVAIGAEANAETGAFAEFHVKKTNFNFATILVLIFVYAFASTSGLSLGFAVALSIMCIAATAWIAVRMARRTAQGKILHDEWLGFKLYLEVAEKYQLQNLTPDLFEKYLPYAMIFGIEKKWAKVFDRAGVTVPQPQWYGGYAGVGMVGAARVGSGAAFSATSFSTSFSSSFSSAIASSFGGGAGGGGGFGGGGAGGGGGGGGGGAR